MKIVQHTLSAFAHTESRQRQQRQQNAVSRMRSPQQSHLFPARRSIIQDACRVPHRTHWISWARNVASVTSHAHSQRRSILSNAIPFTKRHKEQKAGANDDSHFSDVGIFNNTAPFHGYIVYVRRGRWGCTCNCSGLLAAHSTSYAAGRRLA